MQWNAETRYKMLLEINNAVVTRTNREDLFQALAKELRKHFAYDRMAINLYDAKAQSISYFAAADGVQPGGVLTRAAAHWPTAPSPGWWCSRASRSSSTTCAATPT